MICVQKIILDDSDMAETQKRYGTTVELSKSANAVIDTTRQTLGMSKKELVRRVIEAFASLPQEVREAMVRPPGEVTPKELARGITAAKTQQAGAPVEGPAWLTPEFLADLVYDAVEGVPRNAGEKRSAGPVKKEKRA